MSSRDEVGEQRSMCSLLTIRTPDLGSMDERNSMTRRRSCSSTRDACSRLVNDSGGSGNVGALTITVCDFAASSIPCRIWLSREVTNDSTSSWTVRPQPPSWRYPSLVSRSLHSRATHTVSNLPTSDRRNVPSRSPKSPVSIWIGRSPAGARRCAAR